MIVNQYCLCCSKFLSPDEQGQAYLHDPDNSGWADPICKDCFPAWYIKQSDPSAVDVIERAFDLVIRKLDQCAGCNSRCLSPVALKREYLSRAKKQLMREANQHLKDKRA